MPSADVTDRPVLVVMASSFVPDVVWSVPGRMALVGATHSSGDADLGPRWSWATPSSRV
ncbi:hypothetical protein [Curtobacterium sp. MCJR17_043]|uniref:hypothetical protein n=1 Tax=Curtobacterium sp. MCJR17_043 TaxID=2175660 RepID=UPI0024E02BBD|nr:hypothetical protein [Curtobacterium sp. MCJR17_043]WIB35922.1 hypothetical protein DEJ15_01020 [Curtobacterium sp. MCJR17_043]